MSSHVGLLGTTKPRREVEDFGTEASPIDAILVFSDSSNWYLDLQLMYDLITSGKAIDDGLTVRAIAIMWCVTSDWTSKNFGHLKHQ